MRYVEFGEIRTSALGFGCGGVMGRVGRRDSLRAMGAAWDGGVRLFDIARSYGYGEAEGLLGEFLIGRREEATVVTKFGILPSKPAAWKRLAKPVVRAGLALLPSARGLVRKQIAGEVSAGHFDVATLRSSLEASLRALRTEYVDVLLMHEAPVSVMAREDLIAELEKVVSEGKARRAGVSTTEYVFAGMALQIYPELGAAQFPAPLGKIPMDELSRVAQPGPFVMGNHLFGGMDGAAKSSEELERLAQDTFVAESLREKLKGDAKKVLAQVSFDSAFLGAGAHVVVPSMLHGEHVQVNLAAAQELVFSRNEVKAISKWMHGYRRTARKPT
jgi:aryl-alcohol dehydrogenase-like predicted oxidoreductase